MSTKHTDLSDISVLHAESGATDTSAAGSVAAHPGQVIRGETNTEINKSPGKIALIDWLAFSIPAGEGRNWQWVREALNEIFNIPPESWQGTGSKYSGYKHRVNLIYPGERGESVNLGLVAWGGESQRGTIHVSLNGTACARIQDWELVQAFGERVEAVITRVDIAHDDFEGKILNIETARDWYYQNLFGMNGRRPASQFIDDMGSGKGRTLDIGSRKNGKKCRIYEKGKQLGDPTSLWVRGEVEWHNKNRLITWDTATIPEKYLAGAYPCFAYLSKEQCRIKTLKEAASINYQGMVNWLHTAGGKALNVMLQVEGDPGTVMEKLRRDGAPKRLEPYVGLKEVMPGKDDENHKP